MSLRDWIIAHEKLKLKPYLDTVGKLTIGVGRNLDDNGISVEESYFLLDNDIARCKRELEIYPWYMRLDPNRKDAILNMCFNLGISRLLGFKKMIKALERHDYTRAAIEALDSKWASQVKGRAIDVATVLREGK